MSAKRLVKTVTDPRTKKRVYFYGKTVKEINRKMLEYSRNAEIGRSFSCLADEWWEEAEPRLAYQSQKSYIPAMRRAVERFGDIPVKDIKPRDINSFLQALAKEGYAQKTVSNQRLVLNLIFDRAVIENDIEYNPCASVPVPKDTKRTARKAADTSDEDIIKKTYEVWIFPYIALMTGMRKGEILALTWGDINFDEGYISVTKSVYHEGDRPKIKTPKTDAGTRIVPLLEPLKRVLEPLRSDDGKYIVSDTGDAPLTNRRYITLMKHYREVTGVNCTAHQLRHSFATIAFECGIPVKSVQEVLGHKQLSTTMDIYTEFRKSSLDAFKNMMKD